jgi:hypothetical protein
MSAPGRRRFFFEKKKQKTLVHWGNARRQRTPGGKRFLVLFK